MDAVIFRKLIFVLGLTFFVVGCSQGKTTSSVFPDNQGQASSCGQEASANRFIVQWEDGTYTVEKDLDADEFRNGFLKKNLSLIKHVDRDVRIQLEINSSSDASSSATDSGNWGQMMIQAQTLWSKGVSGEGIIIGVIDGMVDTSQVQLNPNILINTAEIPNNGIDDDNNGYVDDYMGIQVNKEINNPKENYHGSHVSGIIAADPTKGPIAGVSPKSKIVPAQFIANDGGGSIGDAIIGMNYAVKRGARIINLSWGAGACIPIPTLKESLQEISNKGVLIVTAAGNGDNYGNGINMDVFPAFPSAYNFTNQINVAASTIDDYMIGFSNYGSRSVHVAAPGVDITSTVPGNGVLKLSGTSMAAPMVSGAAALIWSAFPNATALQVKQALMRSVDIVAGRQIEVASRGRINVAKAYTELQKLIGQ